MPPVNLILMKDMQSEPSSSKLVLNRDVVELTHREWEVLLFLAADLTNAEIAEKLFISEKSVVNYRNRIGCKLNLKGLHKLARYARKHHDELRKWYQLITGNTPPLNC